MNKLILVSALSAISVLLTACGGNDVKSTAKEEPKQVASTVAGETGGMDEKSQAVAEAKMIAKAFGSALKTELKTALKAGGPVAAIEVCNNKAGLIAEEVSKEKNAMISRVSLKNRNPNNVPNDWQKAVLQDFDARAAKGEDVQKLAWSEVVENNGKKQLRFMKALPVGDVCLKCHGTNIDEKVKAKISELYPQDKATGYSKGQIRGAVVVIKEMK